MSFQKFEYLLKKKIKFLLRKMKTLSLSYECCDNVSSHVLSTCFRDSALGEALGNIITVEKIDMNEPANICFARDTR